MKVRFKKCTIDDLDELLKISRSTFFEAYDKVNTVVDIWDYIDRNFNEEKLWKEVNNPDSEFYLATLDNQVAGFIKINSKKAQNKFGDKNSVELEHIYTLKEFFGKGIGQVLLNEAIKITRRKKATFLWLGVWDKNPRAIHFYQKNGFVKFGTRNFWLDDEKQTDQLMKLEL